MLMISQISKIHFKAWRDKSAPCKSAALKQFIAGGSQHSPEKLLVPLVVLAILQEHVLSAWHPSPHADMEVGGTLKNWAGRAGRGWGEHSKNSWQCPGLPAAVFLASLPTGGSSISLLFPHSGGCLSPRRSHSPVCGAVTRSRCTVPSPWSVTPLQPHSCPARSASGKSRGTSRSYRSRHPSSR